MKGRFRVFMFQIPSLPKRTYDQLKHLCASLALDQRQAIILALDLLTDVYQDHPDSLQDRVKRL